MYRPHLDFAFALHDLLPTQGNLPWSPYSVASALGVAAAGAQRRTRGELAGVLAPGGELAELGRVLADAAQPKQAETALANTLWMRAGWHFLDTYQQAVRNWPGGRLRTVDFAGDPEGARGKINEDVEHTTHGLIEQLLAEGTIHPEVAAVIVNALYLKVAWLHPFDQQHTAPGEFKTPSATRRVSTMRQQDSFPYAEVGQWQMVTLPSPGDVAVDVLLPVAATPVTALTAADVLALQQAARPVKVDLRLPRFRVEATAGLSNQLRQLGVTEAFDNHSADFSGITDTGQVWLQQVVHKAVLRVDEQGFEGAAATAVVMRTVSMDISKPIPFHVDRPFVLLVRNRRIGAIYFLARVVDP